jgi:hypothetical protein
VNFGPGGRTAPLPPVEIGLANGYEVVGSGVGWVS